MSYEYGLGQVDPCGREVDAEIVTLESYQKFRNSGQPAQVISAYQSAYEAARRQRELCRQRNGMQVQAVVQPGRTQQETIQNLNQEAAAREARGETQIAQQLRQTAAEVKNIPPASEVKVTSTRSAAPTPAPQQSSGPSFTDIASGISSLLSPLATTGSAILQAQQQAKLAKLQLKQVSSTTPLPMYIPTSVAPNNTLLIGAVAGGALILVLLVAVAMR